MALTPGHPLVRVTHWLEKMFGGTAVNSFCVTEAMKKDLAENWSVDAAVLYDRPAQQFQPISSQERRDLFTRLTNQYPELRRVTDETGVIVSSTSWTEDEDFGVLLEALVKYEEKVKQGDSSLPELVVVITGKGPQKQYYLDKISQLQLSHVSVVTPWLEIDDYPRMLASAHLGVCLHTSSSGLDLPMKVVDMFGCRLPVAAVNFPALAELVKDGVNGRVFDDASELSDIIQEWFENFPDKKQIHSDMRDNIDKFRAVGWDENWDKTALHVFNQREARSSGSGFAILAFFLGLFCVLVSFLPTVA